MQNKSIGAQHKKSGKKLLARIVNEVNKSQLFFVRSLAAC
jgi:hypothetical protein